MENVGGVCIGAGILTRVMGRVHKAHCPLQLGYQLHSQASSLILYEANIRLRLCRFWLSQITQQSHKVRPKLEASLLP